MQRRSDLFFDTDSTGSVFTVQDKDEEAVYLFRGEEDARSRGLCRLALRMYDLGATHKAQEVRKVLGVK
jgi:hypothetical protein